jgi:ParB-like nuclease domain
MPEFKVKDIRPNPFRHMERYPIRRDKVEQLRESYRTTGFWDNIVARLDEKGRPEQAYGHHRKVALEEEFGPNHKVTLIIRDLSDDRMLQIMGRENMEEWGTSAAIEHETVRAVVEAYAEGKIELPAPEGRAGVRYAPSFVAGQHKLPGADDSKPYTVRSIAEFLGWLDTSGKPQDKVGYSLGALELIEEGVLSDSDFDGLSTKDAEAVVKQARAARAAEEEAAQLARREAEEAARRAEQAERDREAAAERERVAREARDQEAAAAAAEARKAAEREQKQAVKQQEHREQQATKHTERGRTRATTAGRAVSSAVRSGEGYRRAPEIAARAVPREAGPPPQIDVFTRRLAADLGRVLDEDGDPRFDRLSELAKYREHIPPFERDNLITTLRNLAERIESFVAQLEGEAPVRKPRAALTRGGR